MYSEEELLAISGIQHYYFCKRQWALIHIEQQWAENKSTMEGKIVHEKVDDPFLVESRKDVFISRSVPLVSYKLGFYGISDAIEFIKSDYGILIKGRQGRWIPNIVEYKRGKVKNDDCDIVQLVLQVMCIEEMLEFQIDSSDIFYNETRRRTKVDISGPLRNTVEQISNEMHRIYDSKTTPKAEVGKHCKSCSLVDICMPRITTKKMNVNNYIERYIKLGGDTV